MSSSGEHEMSRPFDSLYSHGFIRTAVCIPHVRIGDVGFNVERTISLAERASEAGAVLALFPELGISAYSNDDLFQQDALLESVLEGIGRIVERSRSLNPLLLVGAPLRVSGSTYNCAVLIHRGVVIGVVPKSFLPNYREFYEPRQFTSGNGALPREARILGSRVPFGNDLLFEAENVPGLTFGVEVCEDLWVPVPPSTWAALAGATVICNLSASNVTIGKAEYRHKLCATHSGRCVAAYLYSGSGPGESTTDLAWDGHALIYENADLVAEAVRFTAEEQVILGDIDLERLVQDRARLTTFGESVAQYRDRLDALRRVRFELPLPRGSQRLARPIERFPYVPSDPHDLDARCFEAYNIQVHGLMKRLQSTGIERVVIGVSGGLDSTQALIVAARTMDRLGLPRTNVLAYTMPGFATGQRTRENARRLMEVLGVTASEIDIRPSSMQMLRDIGHPFAEGEPIHDVTFENVQAGERTSHLFRLANHHRGLVLGTGDLSELALGWATYGVGDHMSHYNVNVSVPKTLIQYLIRWVAERGNFGQQASDVLRSVLATEISPELVPGGTDADSALQSTEAVIGPFELQDFTLYYVTRFGFRPSRIAFLAWNAWSDRASGPWPPLIPLDRRNEYDLAEIRRWLEVFLFRFFQISQFKRSAIPNGPKVGSGGSLSPRGDWRAPSDSEATLWLEELRRNVPQSI
jgi:NAD+ synthase (glutamine-hydrolysing)